MATAYDGIGIATACVTASGVAGGTPLLTILAAGARKYHHITRFTAQRFVTGVAVTGSAPLVISTANLPGDPQWWMENSALAVGQSTTLDIVFNPPIRSLLANTDTLFSADIAQAQTQYLLSAWYY